MTQTSSAYCCIQSLCLRQRRNSINTKRTKKNEHRLEHRTYMGVNHRGTRGRVLQRGGHLLMQIVPPDFSCFKISSTKLLCNAVKGLPNPWLWQRIHPQCLHQIINSGRNSTLARTRTKNTAQSVSKRHFKWKIIFFWGGASPDPSPSGDGYHGYPSTHPILTPHQAFQIYVCIPQNSSQIYATANQHLHTVIKWLLKMLLTT